MKRESKDDVQICNLCSLAIETKKEQFCEFIHFENKNKIKSIAFYHIECFRNRMNGNPAFRSLQAQAKRILDAAESQITS